MALLPWISTFVCLWAGRKRCWSSGVSGTSCRPIKCRCKRTIEKTGFPTSRKSRSSRTKSAIRIIDKKGPLNNPADRDHCIQYMVAIGLIKGNLTAADYEDDVARDPRIDALRAKMVCIENKGYSRDYLDPKKRSIANQLQIFFKDGTKTRKVAEEYPLGHRRRRHE